MAEKALTNFKNVNDGYAVSYTTKCISNLEDFAQEMMTHDHEEAGKLLLLHAAEVSARNPFTVLHIYSPDTDVFSSYYSQVSNTLCKYSIQDCWRQAGQNETNKVTN